MSQKAGRRFILERAVLVTFQVAPLNREQRVFNGGVENRILVVSQYAEELIHLKNCVYPTFIAIKLCYEKGGLGSGKRDRSKVLADIDPVARAAPTARSQKYESQKKKA